MSGLLGILLIILSIYLYKKIKKKKQVKSAISTNSQGTPEVITSQGIPQKGVQLLESIYIIETSKNLDTVISRYSFVKDLIKDLKANSNSKRYNTSIQASIDEYKNTFYERMITEVQLKLITKPNYEDLENFYSTALLNTFKRYYNQQHEQIAELKRDDAKKRRIKKIESVRNEALLELNKECKKAKDYKSILIEFESFGEDNNNKNINLIESKNNKDSTINNNDLIVNRNSNFELTLLNCDKKTYKKIKTILDDEEIYEAEKKDSLFTLFTEKNIKVKEIEEYKKKYKMIYFEEINRLIKNSNEWNSLGEKDKQDLRKEFVDLAISKIYEKANCNLQLLFEGEPKDETVDDELIKEYGYQNLKTYLNYSKNIDKVRVIEKDNYSREYFENLVNHKLALRGMEIPINEVLMTLTLKELNEITSINDKKFTRKNKAVDYILEMPDFEKIISNKIAFREMFKLINLPEKYSHIDAEMLRNDWQYNRLIVELFMNTYRDSNLETNSNYNSDYISEYEIKCWGDENNICPRAKELMKQKYPKNKVPKLPLHVGCNCSVNAIYN